MGFGAWANIAGTMRLLVTGGAGFIGSNFARYWVEQHPEDHVVVYDVLTYAGNRPSLSDIEDRIVFVQGDICDPTAAEKALRGEGIDTIVHFAAESHNSLAVLNPGLFFRTNVLGTQTMLEAARQAGVARFHHVSTCEVYGDLPLDTDEAFHEDSPYRPRTPYNASKAGADHAVRAYSETYGLPITITNCANNYGPYQFPEKLIPHFCALALDDKALTLYASTENRREWLHVLRPLHRHRCGAWPGGGWGRRTTSAAAWRPPSWRWPIASSPPWGSRSRSRPSSRIVPVTTGATSSTLPSCATSWVGRRRWNGSRGWRRPWRGTRRTQGMVGAAVCPGTDSRGLLGNRRQLRVRILITGADGQLGSDLRDCLEGRCPMAECAVPCWVRRAPAGLATRGAVHRHRQHAGRRPGRRPGHVRRLPARARSPRWGAHRGRPLREPRSTWPSR